MCLQLVTHIGIHARATGSCSRRFDDDKEDKMANQQLHKRKQDGNRPGDLRAAVAEFGDQLSHQKRLLLDSLCDALEDAIDSEDQSRIDGYGNAIMKLIGLRFVTKSLNAT